MRLAGKRPFMDRACLILLLFLLPDLSLSQAPSSTGWQTLTGDAPLIIANGGSSGIFPDQTVWAYSFALTYSVPGIALLCDVQLTKDLQGICRTGLDLQDSTNVNFGNAPPNLLFNTTTRQVNGQNLTGVFSMDITYKQLNDSGASARQSNLKRTSQFDNLFPVLTPSDVIEILSGYSGPTGKPAFLWLNVEYALFYEENGLNMTAFMETTLETLLPGYVSVTEVALLRSLGSIAQRSGAKLIFKIPSLDAVEPSTNRLYSSFTAQEIKNFSSGVLVPKDAIWPVDPQTLYLSSPSTLVQDYHKQSLSVYSGSFQNDEYLFSYNYSFDPVKQYLDFSVGADFTVDGFLSEFPTTASEAISCYVSSDSRSSTLQAGSTPLNPLAIKRTIISHNGASGDYPGCTVMAYTAAIRGGADYIDCPVQLTKDGVAICQESPDLLVNTDASSYSELLMKTTTFPSLRSDAGLFTFNLTWSEISQLKTKQSSPANLRNPAYDGVEGILQLSDFLELAKNYSGTGIFIDFQNAYFLATGAGLNAIDAVVEALKQAGFDGTPNSSHPVLLQSEDSSVLISLQTALPSYSRVYRIQVRTTKPVLAENVTVGALQKIRTFASAVTVPKAQLVEPLVPGIFLLSPPTDVVKNAQLQNLTVYLAVQRNDPTSIAFDYESDPTRELATLTEYYHVDGLISDYPATVAGYLSQRCYEPAPGTLQLSPDNFTIPVVTPGDLYNLSVTYGVPVAPPAPPLPSTVVDEPPFPLDSTAVPLSSQPHSPPTAPKPSPSGVPRLEAHLMLLVFLVAVVGLA